MPSTDDSSYDPNTKKYQDHIICSYGYKLIRVNGQCSKPYKILVKILLTSIYMIMFIEYDGW